MPHPEVALHPIHGPDGSTALPVGHPMHRAGDEVLPDAWARDFVDEMVAGGYAAAPGSATAQALEAQRNTVADAPAVIVETGMRG